MERIVWKTSTILSINCTSIRFSFMDSSIKITRVCNKNTENKVEWEDSDDGYQPGAEDQHGHRQTDNTELLLSLLSSMILYLLVQKLAGPVGPHHDGLDHRYGSNSGCN